MPTDLKALQAATDRILSAAQPHITRPAANWADLRCIEARQWTNQDGDTGWTVIVSEASPDAAELQGYVGLALMEEFGEAIEVETEW